LQDIVTTRTELAISMNRGRDGAVLRNMIVVGELTTDIVERVLRDLEATGELERRTLPLGLERNRLRDAAG
jgi:hypothetical protein